MAEAEVPAGELTQVADEPEVQLAEEPTETPPAVPVAEDVAALRAQLETMQSQLTAAQAQITQAHAVGAAAYDRAATADQRPTEAAPATRPAPPRLSDAQREAFSDPDIAERFIHETANYHARMAYDQLASQVAPLIERLAASTQSWEAIRPAVAQSAQVAAIAEARAASENSGLPPDQFDQLLPTVRDTLWAMAQGNQSNFDKIASNPAAIFSAAQLARVSQRTAPVTTPVRVAPTIGAGALPRAPGTGKVNLSVPEKQAVQWMGEHLGIEKWSPDLLADLNLGGGTH